MLLGSAYGKVEIDSTGLTIGVNNAKLSLTSLAEIGKSVGATIQQVGAMMTVGLTLPIILAGTKAVQYAADLQQTKDKVGLVFGGMSDDMLKWSANSALAFGMSKRDALEAASNFGYLFQQMGVGTQTSGQMSEKLTALAADLAEFEGTDTTTMLQNLQSGLVGRGIQLKRFAIDLSEATVNAKAMAMGLADVNGNISEAAKVQARYQLIMEQTTRVQGFFASQTGDISVQTKIMRAQFEDALATLGTKLLPIVLKVVEGINKILDVFLKLPDGVQTGILVFIGFLAILGPIVAAVGTVISMIFNLVGLIGLLTGAGISVTGVLSGLATVIGIVGTTILATLGSILLLAAGPAILYFAFKYNFMGISTTAQQLWFILKYQFSTGWANLKASTADGWASMTASMQSGTDGAQNIFQSFITWITGAWSNLVTAIGQYATRARDWVVRAFQVDWGALGRNIITGLINGFLSGLTSMVIAATLVANTILATIKRILGIHSPSAMTFKLGESVGEGFLMGISQSMNMAAMSRQMMKPVQNLTTSTQQNLTLQLGNGFTERQARSLIAQNNEELMDRWGKMLGG
jgi:hypothetical protein